MSINKSLWLTITSAIYFIVCISVKTDAESLEEITFLNHTASNCWVPRINGACPSGYSSVPRYEYVEYSKLIVNFKLSQWGPAHTAGIKYTTDGWKTYAIQNAYFVAFSEYENNETWQVTLKIPGFWTTFEYVLFAEDNLSYNTIKTIYYNNNGNGLKIQATGNITKPLPFCDYSHTTLNEVCP